MYIIRKNLLRKGQLSGRVMQGFIISNILFKFTRVRDCALGIKFSPFIVFDPSCKLVPLQKNMNN